MQDMPPDSRYRLPNIDRVELSAFDLYRRKPDVQIDFRRAVFCLIGANGLGKSTYLSSLLYGLTGGIPYRAQRFSSPREYAEEATRLDRRLDYFSGRLSEEAADRAAITVRLSWPGISASVTRQFLGPAAVTALDIQADRQADSRKLLDGSADSAYKELVVKQCGLPNFDQFLFLMHYVCAFDEDRHLLLWDSTALTNALYLAFGSDADQPARANELKREVERLGSRGRNVRFAARKSLDEAARLQKVLSGGDGNPYDEGTLKSYQKLNGQLDEAVERVHRKDVELRKAEVLVADRSAALTGLQLEYEEVFAGRADASSIVRHHPLVRSSVRDNRCAVCATAGVAGKIESLLDRGVCPLCENVVGNGADDMASLERLKVLDSQIEQQRGELESILRRRGRLKDDYTMSMQAEEAARTRRNEFLEAHPDVHRQAQSVNESESVNTEIKRLREAADRFDRQSKKEYRKRDEARRTLHNIESELRSRFGRHSDQFTDLFRKYAAEFVGLTVDIDLEHRGGRNETGFELLLSLEDQARSKADAVSESQRFFLDIALRMALSEYMSPSRATLFIDTPEGSLDITYEARAGQMFSKFAERSNAIVMTANLRSSALLRRLAESQKHSGMQIERMTDWTDLSEVQRAEEGLFDKAYDEIEQALK